MFMEASGSNASILTHVRRRRPFTVASTQYQIGEGFQRNGVLGERFRFRRQLRPLLWVTPAASPGSGFVAFLRFDHALAPQPLQSLAFRFNPCGAGAGQSRAEGLGVEKSVLPCGRSGFLPHHKRVLYQR